MKHPLVIGAMGGSGTRVIAHIVRHAGYFMGTNLNISEDAMEFVAFYDRWINHFICTKEVPLTDVDTAQMKVEFDDCVAKHHLQMPN
jgi:hypothetical protein